MSQASACDILRGCTGRCSQGTVSSVETLGREHFWAVVGGSTKRLGFSRFKRNRESRCRWLTLIDYGLNMFKTCLCKSNFDPKASSPQRHALTTLAAPGGAGPEWGCLGQTARRSGAWAAMATMKSFDSLEIFRVLPGIFWQCKMSGHVWVWQAKGCTKYSLKCLSGALGLSSSILFSTNVTDLWFFPSAIPIQRARLQVWTDLSCCRRRLGSRLPSSMLPGWYGSNSPKSNTYLLVSFGIMFSHQTAWFFMFILPWVARSQVSLVHPAAVGQDLDGESRATADSWHCGTGEACQGAKALVPHFEAPSRICAPHTICADVYSVYSQGRSSWGYINEDWIPPLVLERITDFAGSAAGANPDLSEHTRRRNERGSEVGWRVNSCSEINSTSTCGKQLGSTMMLQWEQPPNIIQNWSRWGLAIKDYWKPDGRTAGDPRNELWASRVMTCSYKQIGPTSRVDVKRDEWMAPCFFQGLLSKLEVTESEYLSGLHVF